MKKVKSHLIAAVLLLSALKPVFAAEALGLLNQLSPLNPSEITISTPAWPVPLKYEKPPCVPSQHIAPGRAFVPVVSDARRVQAISDLLSRIAVCRPMPYDNDGVVHTDPHHGLPKKPAGYYKEYTLIVPGRDPGDGPETVLIGGIPYQTGPVLSKRGPERLMIGDGREVFYTPDHYETFVRLNIVR